MMCLTVAIWVQFGGMHSSIAQQLAYNGLYKLHRDSLCVLARIMKTVFRGVESRGMQEQLEKMFDLI